jgi:hypothetical protein
MSIEDKIRQLANETAARVQKRATYLHNEYLEAEKFAAAKKAEFDFANLAPDRVASFQPEIGGQLQCPFCWIEKGIKSAFRPVHTGTRDDVFRCQNRHEHILTY